MKVPIVPIVVAAAVLAAAVYLFTVLGSPKLVLGVPQVTRLADLDGVETDVAVAPDGVQCAVVVDGNLWLLNLNDGSRKQITSAQQAATSPAWMPDGRTLAFTRGGDTFAVSEEDLQAVPKLFKSNAIAMTWSVDGRIAFVRDRDLWLADGDGTHERRVVEADQNPDVHLHSPRFSPDSTQIAFIKSFLNLRGEIWLVHLASATQRALVADRPAENPMDLAWMMEGHELVYLTNRSGAYALWHINLSEDTILPLTTTLNAAPLSRLGISAVKNRIVVPRHFLDSDIVLSDGTKLAATPEIESQPAISPDGKRIAYTVQRDTQFEVWTVGIHGENPTFKVLGREPRFSPNGFQIVYTNTDPSGNEDVWRVDLRTDAAESLTDAPEIDLQPDWSRDGRHIAFASALGGPLSVWSIPADGGKRLRLNDGGAYPRFFGRGGQSLVFWNLNAFWTMDVNGGNLHRVRDGITELAPPLWTANGPRYYRDLEVSGGQRIWPEFDRLADGRFILAPIDIRETSLWAVDLTFHKK
jgi:Tol biopolymer transport system component